MDTTPVARFVAREEAALNEYLQNPSDKDHDHGLQFLLLFGVGIGVLISIGATSKQ